MTTACEGDTGTVPAAGASGLMAWAQESGRRRVKGPPALGGLRFVFYGRVSTEDWQDPVTSRARQREQAEVLVRGYGAARNRHRGVHSYDCGLTLSLTTFG